MNPWKRYRAMRSALLLIAGDRCEKTTLLTRRHWCLNDQNRWPDLHYTADKWCDACLAHSALEGIDPLKRRALLERRGVIDRVPRPSDGP